MKKTLFLLISIFICVSSINADDFKKNRIIGNADAQLRSKPGSKDTVTMIPKSTSIEIVEMEIIKQGILLHSWYKTTYEGKTGWVSGLVLENPDPLLLDIPQDQQLVGELRNQVQDALGEEHLITDVDMRDNSYFFTYELKSYSNIDIDRTNLKNNVAKIMNIFISMGVDNYQKIEVTATTETDIKKDIISKIVVTYDEVKRCEEDPYAQKQFEVFTLDDSFYEDGSF